MSQSPNDQNPNLSEWNEPDDEINLIDPIRIKNIVMDNKEILKILRREKSYLSKNFGLSSIGLFGSFAKGKQSSDSDIDLLVELKEPRFDFLAGIQIYLERKFGRPVEIIRKRKGLSERFLKKIEKDIHYV